MKITIENLVSITESNVGKKRDKVEHGFYKEIAIIQGERSTPCRFRFYNTGQTIHCIAWLSGDEHYTSGYGKAGGYGYCKESAAMQSAIINSGIKMDRHWGGSGESSMREAAFDIAKKLTGKRKFILHTAHA
tara:strand:+ start:261 stop:656 length:396 start_codon:yes stop_codon:yes gene_type:complete